MATDPQHTAAVAFLSWLLLLPSLGEALRASSCFLFAVMWVETRTREGKNSGFLFNLVGIARRVRTPTPSD